MQLSWQEVALTVAGPKPEQDFSVIVEQTPTTIGGASGTLTVKDVIWTTQTDTGSDNNFRILNGGASFESATPAVCSVDSSGQVLRVADGLADVRVSMPGLGTRKYTQQLTRSGAAVVKTGIQSLASGSLLKYLTDQRNAILAASTPNAAHQRSYVNADGSGGQNTGNMLRRTDVAGFTALNLAPVLAYSYRYLTPHHRIVTYHTNTPQYWSANDYGQLVSGLSDTAVIYEKYSNRTDICKLLPATWRNYLPTPADAVLDIPVWSRRTWVGPTDNPERYWTQAATLKTTAALAPVDALAATFAHPSPLGGMGYNGDSGTPVFMGINGDSVLVGHVSQWGGLLNAHYGDYISAINAALVATATAGGDADPSSYAVSTVDLSGFNAY